MWLPGCAAVCLQGTKVNSKGKEVPHGVRLYSIASSRYGDAYDGKTTTLCVRRAVYNDPETGKEDPAKKGICSNFLCDAKPGDEIMMTGACMAGYEHGSGRSFGVPSTLQLHAVRLLVMPQAKLWGIAAVSEPSICRQACRARCCPVRA